MNRTNFIAQAALLLLIVRSPIFNRKPPHTSHGLRAFAGNASFILLRMLPAFACNSALVFSGRTSERQGAASLRETFRARCRMPAFRKRLAHFCGGAGLLFPARKVCEKCPKCRFSECAQVLTASCKRAENVLSLRREKRGYAPRAYPLFCYIEYQ